MPPTNSTTPERLRGFFDVACAGAVMASREAAIQHKATTSCLPLKNPPVTERMLGFVLGLGLRLGLARVSHDESADRASAVKVRTACSRRATRALKHAVVWPVRTQNISYGLAPYIWRTVA